MRVLLVEDTDSLRELFARMLRHRGFEVCEAADGSAALECLATFTPDLVLTDLMMPQLDGVGLMRRLRAMPGLGAVPVVVMTAMSSEEAEREARRAGASDFLHKPLEAGTLFDRVGRYC
jgi:DNA-binding response OmpR family regulator